MTVAIDGRFCASCAKNVIDFSSKSPLEIQQILRQNSAHPICGRFRKTQLTSIKVAIPEAVFFQKMPFRRAFLLVLFTTMGSVLFSCSDDEGQKQSIEAVEIVEEAYDEDFMVAGMVYLPLERAADETLEIEGEDPPNHFDSNENTGAREVIFVDSVAVDSVIAIDPVQKIPPDPKDSIPKFPQVWNW